MKSSTSKGFTMLEMAMVVTIIGLLVGAVMVGQHFVRSAQIRSAISEYGQYMKAIKFFQDKYQALPGDMSNAQSAIGANKNGDGNGRIDFPVDLDEKYILWTHLEKAKLISGIYIDGEIDGSAVPGSNIPASSVAGGGWVFVYYLHNTNTPDLWGDSYGHIFLFGGYRVYSYGGSLIGDLNKSPIITASEAFDIDSKLDDGKPGRGSIRAWRTINDGTSPTPKCAANDTTQDSMTYNEQTSGKNCSLIFITGF